jgi:hypothetical protein
MRPVGRPQANSFESHPQRHTASPSSLDSSRHGERTDSSDSNCAGAGEWKRSRSCPLATTVKSESCRVHVVVHLFTGVASAFAPTASRDGHFV